MLMQKDFLNKLKDFGLNSYEAAIWTALLSRGVSTAGELSDIANVPRSRSYDVLESLEKKGFIIMKVGKPIKYLAVPPEEVVERVKQRIRDNAEKQVGIVEGVKQTDVLSELISLHTKGIDMVDPSDITSAVKGRDNLYTHIETLIKNAKNEVVIVTSSEGATRKLACMERTMKKAKTRGVNLMFGITDTKIENDTQDRLKALGEVKQLKGIPGRFIMIDDNQICFMLMDDKTVHPSYDTGVWVQTKQFSNTVRNLLDNVWN